MDALGIDLGTTNTVAAIGKQVIGIDEDGVMPSVVAFLPTGTVQTGAAARRRRAIDSQNTVFSSKRILGRPWDSSEVQWFRERYPFEMVRSGEWPAFQTRAGAFTPVDIGGILLGTIFEHLKRMVSGLDVAITVPAGFNQKQRDATLEAASQANFGGATLIDEPVAAALAYLELAGPVSKMGVYDLGGGTFDFAVLDWADGALQVRGSASDLFLGGDDIDQKIAGWVATTVLKQHNWDLTNYPEIFDRLLAECEQAKIRLSSDERTTLDLTQVDPDLPSASQGIILKSEVVDKLAGELVPRTFVTCDHVLSEAGLRPQDLDAVLLVGGSTHLAAVKRGVEAYFGKPGRDDLEPTKVVALGASLGRG